MKKFFLYILLPVVLIAAGVGGYLIMTTGGEYAANDDPGTVPDTLMANLPKNEKAAKKEFQNAQKALAKLKPAKPYIVIDTHSNKIYLRTEDSVLLESTCSTGSGGIFVDSTTGRKWMFNTPRGVFKVNAKIPHPWWRKPDWAFLEEGEKVPKSEGDRLDPNMMGDYALGFGEGYYIHGTIYERLLGINVTHGCVRVGSDDLEKLYNRSPMGTMIYIF